MSVASRDRLMRRGSRHQVGHVASLAVVIVFVGLVGCGQDSATDEQRGDDWNVNADAESDAPGDDPDGGLVDTLADAGDGDDAKFDAGEDIGVVEPDASTGEGLTESAVASGPWYGVIRLTESPGITGSLQILQFDADGSVTIGPAGKVSGSWEIFDDDSVRLYELERENSDQNQPSQYVLEAEVDENNRLTGFELFMPTLADGSGGPYTVEYEQLGASRISFSELQGRWRSVGTFEGDNGQTQQLELRFGVGRTIGYGIAGENGGYFELFRHNGELLQVDDGTLYWLAIPGPSDRRQWGAAGEIRPGGSETVIFAPRAIDEDGEPGAEDWDGMELEYVGN